MLRYRWIVVAVLAVLISGVGLGSSSASAVSYDSEELRFLQLINEYRGNNGVGPLTLSDALSVSSERHSEDMAKYDFFAHNTATSSYYAAGSRPWDRMAAEGYDYNTFKGENIAVGYDTARESFEAWRNSPSHNAAMLDGNYRVIGIGRLHYPGPGHEWYWTTDFGGFVDPTSHAPGEDPQAPEPQQKPEKPVDLGGIENGAMNGKAVWRQEAIDGADLILDAGYARLGGYHNGEDDLRQRIRVREDSELSYGIKINTAERQRPVDRLVVRLTDEKGQQIVDLRKYTDADGWTREVVNLSRFATRLAGRTVYLSFYVETDPTQLTTFYVDNVVLKDRARASRSGSLP